MASRIGDRKPLSPLLSVQAHQELVLSFREPQPPQVPPDVAQAPGHWPGEPHQRIPVALPYQLARPVQHMEEDGGIFRQRGNQLPVQLHFDSFVFPLHFGKEQAYPAVKIGQKLL